MLQVSGVPIGRAKHIVNLMRNNMHPHAGPSSDTFLEVDTPRELPGFNFVLKKMLDTSPPQEVYRQMRDAVRMLSQEGNQVSKAQRLDIERRIAGIWVDHAMPNLAKRSGARRAFLANLEQEGYPGMPRPTVQSLQEYLSREFLPVSRSQRVIDHLRHDISQIDVVVRHHVQQPVEKKPVRWEQRQSSSMLFSPRTAQTQASLEQSQRQQEYNEYIRQLKSAVRKIKRDDRKAIVADIDARLAPDRERLRKISHIHEVARETPSRIKAVVKRVEALRARIKLRRELKKKADAAKAAKQS